MDERVQHILKCAAEVLDGYTFKMTNILDANHRCIPQKNRVAIHQLDRSFMSLGDEYEEIVNGKGRDT